MYIYPDTGRKFKLALFTLLLKLQLKKKKKKLRLCSKDGVKKTGPSKNSVEFFKKLKLCSHVEERPNGTEKATF